MDQQYASKYHRLEKDHWWFLGRRDIIYKLIKDYNRDSEILEIGCSGGVLLAFLQSKGFKRIYGIDIDENAIELCRQKGITSVQVARGEETGFKDQQFDMIIASDVLEHIQDENKTLFEWHRILKFGRSLIIFVPAFKFLWSKHDEVNHHYRRYAKSDIFKILERNGFKVERISYWNFTLFVPVSFIRLFQKLLPSHGKKSGDQLYEVTPFMNKTLEYLLRLDNKLLSLGINFPFGISVFAIARKI